MSKSKKENLSTASVASGLKASNGRNPFQNRIQELISQQTEETDLFFSANSCADISESLNQLLRLVSVSPDIDKEEVSEFVYTITSVTDYLQAMSEKALKIAILQER